MSLDVYLKGGYYGTERVIYDQACGGLHGWQEKITQFEWHKRHPGDPPPFAEEPICGFESNITHNLGKMARAVGDWFYMALWRPEEVGITKASQLIDPLTRGLEILQRDRARLEQFNASNGWGLYEHFVPWVSEYLEACKENPEADVSVSR